MLTDLGKMIKNLCTDADLKQEQLAFELNCSSGKLSNYMNGKTAPDMDILAKIVDRFNLKEKELKGLFSKAFFNAVQNNQKIVLDTRFIREDRVKPLVQIVITLLLT
jgi:transcriptional regulator with XRE-family HTH domain